MEEHEEKRDFHALGGEAVGVACPIAFKESVRPHLAQVIAQLVEPVALSGQTKVDQECLMELVCPPATDQGARVQQHFHEPDHPSVVDLDAGILRGPDGDREREPL
jgi:hypothetical protein